MRITPISANPKGLGKLGGIASGKARKETERTQAIGLQKQAWKDATNKKTPVHIRAAIMRAWCDITQVLRDIDGKGKPRPVIARNDPEAKAKAKRKTFAPPTVVKESLSQG